MKTVAQGESKLITPVVATGAKSSGQCIGGKISIDVSNGKTSENSVLVQNFSIVDKDKLNKKIRAVIFKNDFVAQGDGVAFNPTAAECLEIIDDIEVSSYKQYGNAYVGISKQLALLVAGNTSRKFYIQLVAGEALTIASANPISLVINYYID